MPSSGPPTPPQTDTAPHLEALTPEEIRRELFQDLERFAAIGTFFAAVARGGEVPPVPEGLPEALLKILAGLAEAVGEA